MSEPTWAQRKAWNNDGMDPDWVSSRHNKSEVEKLKLENQRLREALKKIIAGEIGCPCCDLEALSREDMATVARAALGGGE